MKASLKSLALLFVVLPLAFVVSCGDDEEDINREPLILGTWTLESQKVTNVKATVSGLPVGIPESVIKELVDTLTIIPQNSKITFNQDLTYSIKAPQRTTDASGSWSLSEDQNTITITGLEDAQTLLGSSSLAFVIQRISNTDFSLLTSVPEITIPNIPNLGSVKASGDYQMELKK